MSYKEIVSKVAKEVNLPEEVVLKTYNAYWRFIRESIQQLPLKDNLSEEEFKLLKTNFNIPSIGKLACTYDRYKGKKKQFEEFKNLKHVYNKESKADV